MLKNSIKDIAQKKQEAITLFNSVFLKNENIYEIKKNLNEFSSDDVFILLLGAVIKKNDLVCIKILNDFKTIDGPLHKRNLGIFNFLEIDEVEWFLNIAKNKNIDITQMTKPDLDGLTALGRAAASQNPHKTVDLLLNYGFKVAHPDIPIAAWLALSGLDELLLQKFKMNEITVSDLIDTTILGATAIDIAVNGYSLDILEAAMKVDPRPPYFKQYGSFINLMKANQDSYRFNFDPEYIGMMTQLIEFNQSTHIQNELKLVLKANKRNKLRDWSSQTVAGEAILDYVKKLNETMLPQDKQRFEAVLEKREMLDNTSNSQKFKNKFL